MKQSISHYSSCAGLDSIHIVWSEPNPPSESLVEHLNHILQSKSKGARRAELKFDINKEDSLNNRFKEIKDLKTDAVFSIDDDVIFPCSSVEFAFNVWQSAPDTMVGFVPRAHWFDRLVWQVLSLYLLQHNFYFILSSLHLRGKLCVSKLVSISESERLTCYLVWSCTVQGHLTWRLKIMNEKLVHLNQTFMWYFYWKDVTRNVVKKAIFITLCLILYLYICTFHFGCLRNLGSLYKFATFNLNVPIK